MTVLIGVFVLIVFIGYCYGMILIDRLWHSEWLRKGTVRIEEAVIRLDSSSHEYENLLHEYEVKYSMNKNKD